jgi:hypothetical protein
MIVRIYGLKWSIVRENSHRRAIGRLLLDISKAANTSSQCHRALRSRSMPPPYFLHSLALQEGHQDPDELLKITPGTVFCLIGTPHLPQFSDSGTVTAFMPVFTGADLYLCAMKFRNDEIVES